MLNVICKASRWERAIAALVFALVTLSSPAMGQQPRVRVIKESADFYTAGFGNDIQLRIDNGTCKADGTAGRVYVSPQIVMWGPHERHSPVCYTWNSKPNIAALFATKGFVANKNLPVFLRVTTGDGQTLEYQGTGSFGPNSGTVTNLTTADTLAAKISNTTATLNWWVMFDGTNWTPAGSGSTKMYVLKAAPGGAAGAVTNSRVNFVTDKARGKTSGDTIVRALWDNFYIGLTYTGGAKPPHWQVPDGAPAECIDIVKSMVAAVSMTGAATGTAITVCPAVAAGGGMATALANVTRGSSTGQSGHTGNAHATTERLIFLDYSTPVGAPNNFEAAMQYTTAAGATIYYTGGAGGPYASQMDVLKASATSAPWWILTMHTACIVPGPNPQWTWAGGPPAALP